MKCVIYLRTSTQDQKERKTIDSQRHECQRYAESQGWEIVDTIADEAMSGSFTENRLGWQSVKQIMVQGKTEIVLVPELSRITRTSDLRERGDILQTFIDSKVLLATPSRGIIDLSEWQNELLTGIELSIARQERETIAKRMRRGRLAKLEKGQYCQPSVPYGLLRWADKNVKPVEHFVEHEPDEYRVMRLIWDKIVNEGWSLNTTVAYLNEVGIKTRRGRRWEASNLSRILKKDSLTGTIVTNRHMQKMTAEGGKRVLDKNGKPKLRPKEEWIRVKVPAIYTEEENKVLRQRLLENRKGNPKRNKPDDPFWLRGKLRCGLCGAMFGTKPTTVNYYMCHNRTKSPKHRAPGEEKCLVPVVNADAIHHMIENDVIFRLLTSPEKVLKAWTNIGLKKTAIKQTQAKMTRIEKEIVKKDTESERLLDEAIRQSFSESVITSKAAELKQSKEVLEAEAEKVRQELVQMLKAQANADLLDESVKEIRTVSSKLAGKVKTMPIPERKKLLEYLVPPGSFIEIYPIGTLEYGGGGMIKKHRKKEYVYKFKGKGKKYRITWEYDFKGIIDIGQLVGALKEYHTTGTISLLCSKSMIAVNNSISRK